MLRAAIALPIDSPSPFYQQIKKEALSVCWLVGSCGEKKITLHEFHIHIQSASTQGYVVLVVEFSLATPKPTKKHVANQKSNRIPLLSCGVP
jgi:hypothetical protein